MTTWTVRQSGGNYSTLNAALANASTVAGDVISIEGAWTVPDTTQALIFDSGLTIQTDATSRHPGYYDDTLNHYRLITVSGHALILNGAFSATIDGLAMIQAGTGVSDEAIRCTPGTSNAVTVKNCIMGCSNNTNQQDCIYIGFNQSIGTITLENCVLTGAARAGIHAQNFFGATATGTLNVNSCILWNNGRDITPGSISSVGGGIRVQANTGNGSGFTINVHNSIAVENNTGSGNGGESPLDFNDSHIGGTSVGAFNVSYSIDSDGSIAIETDGGIGNLASRTATDSTTPGAGNWVIFEDITNTPFDLRLVDNAENDAQDMHAVATAHGLTIPATDITGTSRPQDTNYDAGAFEVVAAGGGGTFTADGAVTLPVLQAAGTATHVAPTYSATGAVVLPALAASGTATHVAPAFTATGAVTLPALTAAGTATSGPPSFDATGAVTLPALTATGTATHVAPTFAATGTATLPALTASGTGTHVAPPLSIYASSSVANGSGNSGLTIEDAVSLPDAAALTGPGTTVWFLNGTYLLANSFAPTISGTEGAWITYRPLNPGGAIIQWDSVANDPMFYLLTTASRGISYIEINGLIFDGVGVATNGIFCQRPSGGTSNPHHLRFIDNVIQNTGSSGIASIKCDYLTAIGNRIHNVGMVRGWGSGIAYNTNVWHDNDPSFHNVILNNVISGVYDCCGTNRINDPGDDTDITDGNGIIIDRSDVGDSSPPTMIANNVIYMNGGRGILTFHAGNVWIINNTCYQNLLDLLIGNDGSALFDVGTIQIGGFSENNYILNNIAYSWTPRNSYQLMTDSDAVWLRNLWYGGEGLFGIDPLIESDPDHFVNADPLFVNPPFVDTDPEVGEQYLNALDPASLTTHFHLQSGSPAIDAGIDPRTVSGQKIVLSSGTEVTDVTALTDAMTTYLLTDAEGEARASSGLDWNLGAYETVIVAYSATGAPTLPALTATGTATHEAPVFTATGAVILPALEADGTATHTAPAFTATGAAILPAITASGTATSGAPAFDASGEVTLPALTASGNATHEAPTFTASGAVTLPSLEASGTAFFSTTIHIATGALVLPLLSASGTATFTIPIRTATGALVLAAMTADGLAEHTPPIFTATGAVTLPKMTAMGIATLNEVDVVPDYIISAEVEMRFVASASIDMRFEVSEQIEL